MLWKMSIYPQVPASIAVTEWSVNGHTGTAFWPDDISRYKITDTSTYFLCWP